ncbi:uncharacterized protein LOC122378186 isoform X1 [Amphibalanus amphitrite]|uniref:uncharacterized protein LOC122378186 isoform X1 n=1 Tax=Amphibalanus amphitrite TaxID=1232801 RepID=UPI001C913D83|nr:uncharacterized protein LOC122378186 isoform X1 [Amphibalanus amphitrite]
MGECYLPGAAEGTTTADRRPRLVPREKPAPVSCEPPGLDVAEPAETRLSDTEEEELPRRCPAALRCRQREQRRRVLRLATDKLTAVEDLRERDLRQATLLQNMAARLEAEAKAERAARAARQRGVRAYARTLGRSFGDPSSAERRRRRREENRLLDVDVQEMFSDIYNQPAPVLIGPLDEDDEAPLKFARRWEDEELFPAPKRARTDISSENTDPSLGPTLAPAPQEQVRFDEPPRGCGAAAGFTEFHMFHHLVPSLES